MAQISSLNVENAVIRSVKVEKHIVIIGSCARNYLCTFDIYYAFGYAKQARDGCRNNSHFTNWWAELQTPENY